jgi:predicted Rossmann fold flavoprotein
VSIPAEVTASDHVFRENILFTHRGLSGPAILQASNYWSPGEPITIDLMPDKDLAAIVSERRSSKQRVDNSLGTLLPSRAAEYIAGPLSSRQLNQLNDAEADQLIRSVKSWDVQFARTAGFDRAEVTLGGVSTDELSSQTMESKRVAGLYFIGEVVDVTGWLGGYNFQWAWASGYAAGQAV